MNQLGAPCACFSTRLGSFRLATEDSALDLHNRGHNLLPLGPVVLRYQRATRPRRWSWQENSWKWFYIVLSSNTDDRVQDFKCMKPAKWAVRPHLSHTSLTSEESINFLSQAFRQTGWKSRSKIDAIETGKWNYFLQNIHPKIPKSSEVSRNLWEKLTFINWKHILTNQCSSTFQAINHNMLKID